MILTDSLGTLRYLGGSTLSHTVMALVAAFSYYAGI